MAVERIESALPTTTKIEQLNDQTIELLGQAQRARFDKVELDQYFVDSGMVRKFRRDVGMGSTAATFGEWVHFKAESGYSIWRIAPANYLHNSNNALYFDDHKLTFKGLATAESATSFDSVFTYDGATFTTHTTESFSESGTSFSLMGAPSHFLYIGLTSTFGGVQFRFDTKGGNYTLKAEYYNGTAWVELTAASNSLVDNTVEFVSDGTIEWTIPSDWAQTTVNAANRYWIRLSTTSSPTTTAKAFQIVPGNSVVSLLGMSSNELIKEQWRWCSFNSSVYVTIRNAGSSTTEGNFYVTSASSSTNKQAFFVTNHTFEADFEDSSYSAGGLGVRRALPVFENVTSGALLYLEGSDQKGRLASAHRSLTMPVRYMATENINSGATGTVLEMGEFTYTQWTWTPTRRLYVGSGAGTMTHTPGVYSGSQIQRVGVAQSATRVLFEPELGNTNPDQLILTPLLAVAGSGASVSSVTLQTTNDTNISKRVASFLDTRNDACDWITEVPGDAASGSGLHARLRARTSATSGQASFQVHTARTTIPAASDPTLEIHSGAMATVPGSANQTFQVDIPIRTTVTAKDQLNIRVVRMANTDTRDTVAATIDVLYLSLEYAEA